MVPNPETPTIVNRHGAGGIALDDRRFLVVGGVNNGGVFVGGGKNGEDKMGSYLSSCVCYDAVTGEWSDSGGGSRLPKGRSHFGIARIGTCLFVMGGEDQNGVRSDLICLAHSEEIVSSPGKGNGKNLAPANEPPRSAVAGNSKDLLPFASTKSDSSDHGESDWKTLAPMIVPRSRFACASDENYIYVFGGIDGNGEALDSAERYTVATNTWELLPTMPDARHSSGVGIVGNTIYIVGGVDRGGNAMASTLVFDTSILEYSTKIVPDMETKCYGASIVAVDRYLVAVGGIDDTGQKLSRIYVLDTKRNAWGLAPTKLVQERGHFAAGYLKESNTMVVTGGSRHDATNTTEHIFCGDSLIPRSFRDQAQTITTDIEQGRRNVEWKDEKPSISRTDVFHDASIEGLATIPLIEENHTSLEMQISDLMERVKFLEEKEQIYTSTRNWIAEEDGILEEDIQKEVYATFKYPPDCYSLIALNGPGRNGLWANKPRLMFFLFGILVFVLQMSLLILSIWSSVDAKNGTVGESGNPDQGFWPIFIRPNANLMVRVTQVVSALLFVIFPEASLKDVVTAIHIFPWSSTKTGHHLGPLRLACFLRFVQGISAIVAAWLLVMTSDTVVDIILNFTAINFISNIDDLAFELVESGVFGPALKEEASIKVRSAKLPACVCRERKDVWYWRVMASTFLIFFGFMIFVFVNQDRPDKWVTTSLRVEFKDIEFKKYSGCYDLNKTAGYENKRYSYNREDQESNIVIGYCRDYRQWIFFDMNHENVSNACDARNEDVDKVRSTKTDSFDISSSFEERWVSSSGTPLELFFFNNEDELLCDFSLGDGICNGKLNTAGYSYDEGDCCGATCTGSNCWQGNDTAFGVSSYSSISFPNCTDPRMEPISIRLNSIKSSRSEETPVTPYFSLDCGEDSILSAYIDGTMENQAETVHVEDGAKCNITVQDIASATDNAIWYVNYSVFHVNSDLGVEIEILTHDSSQGEMVEFKRIPECFIVGMDGYDDYDLESIYTAIDWMAIEADKGHSNCRDQLALFTISYKLNTTGIIDVRHQDHCRWPSVTCRGGNVEALNWSYKLGGSIPTEIRYLEDLKMLELDNNQLGSLPTEIGGLVNLTHLDLGHNQLQSLPAEIGGLVNLISLDIGDNYQLGSLPTEIGYLVNLTSLELENNQLQSLPTEIGGLVDLTYLDLAGNQLQTLPTEIGNLVNLISLDLGDNYQLGSLPAEIGNLVNLISLDLGPNQLGSLPTEIWNFVELTYLDLGFNQLQSLPTEIKNLVNLTSLNIGGNQLQSLTTEIGNLVNLTSLVLSINQLQSLPTEIGNLVNLTSLKIGDNQLQSLPIEIGNLVNLTSLVLSSNQLGSLPIEIGNLVNLTSLKIGDNQLQSLPTEIGNFVELTYLEVENNQLGSLPTEIGNFVELTYLNLENNQLGSLPTEIGKLVNLEALRLEDNGGITDLPDELRKLTNLKRLYLSGTNVTCEDVPGLDVPRCYDS